ncbi:hypothetical protein [Edaphobacter aggregans]|uniref:hypothetical protein n=1 Tax=Edaphobacter aggregans TaxID=570835 RepID=UPI00055253B7|nr:hypothetical protein [Edaphobacter aggregans]
MAATLPSGISSKAVTSLLGAKTISQALAYVIGSVNVIELVFSDATSSFIKVGPNSALEIGGTFEMNTGTKVICN